MNRAMKKTSEMNYQVKLDIFQGPLDLLLHLIEKSEIDIYNIPIAVITEKYLEYLVAIQFLDLDTVGEFLVMAATLMQIKAKLLLPQSEAVAEAVDPEEEEDPRWELVCKLIEYKRIKEATLKLQQIEVGQLKVYTRVAGEFPDQTYAVSDDTLQSLSVWDLMDAFKIILESLEVKLLKAAIPQPELSLKQRMAEILELVEKERRISFKRIFVNVTSKIDLIICFLAVLELIRLHRMVAFQAGIFEDIYLEQKV